MSRPVSLPILFEGWLEDVPAATVTGIRRDAKRVGPGDAYLCIDDHPAQAALAVARGAAALIHDGPAPRAKVPVVALPGLRQRLPELAARFYHYPAEQLHVAVTAGRAGAAAVSYYLAQSWQRAAGGAGLVGSVGCGPYKELRDSVPSGPLDLQRTLAELVERDIGLAAVEADAPMLEQGWLDPVAIDVAVFTGLGSDGEAAGVRQLFTRCSPRFAVIDHDRAEGKTLSRLTADGTQVLTYGSNGATELQGAILNMDSTGMNVRLAGPWGGGELRTGLLGRANLSGLLAAAGALALSGMPWNRVMHQLEIMSPLPGRLSCIGGGHGQPAAVIDHANTPEELEQVLRSLRAHLHGRLLCVLAPRAREVSALRRVAETLADEVRVATRATRPEVIRSAIRACAGGDIVLIAGSGHGNWRLSGETAVRDLLEEAA